MHVVVTGGSSGIGLEVARIYAARGARLTLVARGSERLHEARARLLESHQGGRADIHVASVDVGSEPELTRALASAQAELGPCDILVACAGMVEPGLFEDVPGDIFREQVQTNLYGVVNAVRAVYPQMKARGDGRIMIVSSGLGLIGIHGYSAYSASKSALIGFAETLGMEAAGTGVRISICFPPDTLTPQFEGEIARRSPEAHALVALGSKSAPWTAEAVARRLVRGIDRGVPRLYFGFSITALGLFGSLIKAVLAWWYARKPKG